MSNVVRFRANSPAVQTPTPADECEAAHVALVEAFNTHEAARSVHERAAERLKLATERYLTALEALTETE